MVRGGDASWAAWSIVDASLKSLLPVLGAYRKLMQAMLGRLLTRLTAYWRSL